MKLSLETITSFQQVYEQINGRSIDEENSKNEIRDLYENLVLTTLRKIPANKKKQLDLLKGAQ